MSTMTLRDVPEDLHQWLKQQAAMHHRSVNKEVIVALEELRGCSTATRERPSVKEIMAIAHRVATAPELDPRSADEIIGYDENGIPS